MLAISSVSFLIERTGELPPQKLNHVTELLENSTRETPIIMRNHNVKHNIMLKLHTFACRVFIDANPGNSIPVDIYSMLVK